MLEIVCCFAAYAYVWVATTQKARVLQYMGWGLYVCLHVLNLGEQEHAWITGINIMDWETLDMVVRYTRSVKFEDSLKVYEKAIKG